MSEAQPTLARWPGAAAASTPWLVALAGFAAMYLPVYWWAGNSIWQTDEQGHGPIILAVLVWLFWTLRRPIAESPTEPAPVLGWPLFVFGLFTYVVGRAFDISILEFGSQMFVVAGTLSGCSRYCSICRREKPSPPHVMRPDATYSSPSLA